MPKSRQERRRRLPPFGLTRLSDSSWRKAAFVELYQAEWCPHSHKVRQRLTELGLDFWARQVAADPGEREQMQQHVGTNEIPLLVPDDDEPVCGEDDILEYLGRFDERADADAHREKAREEVPTFAEVGSAQR
jgi:glutathione S-transferase